VIAFALFVLSKAKLVLLSSLGSSIDLLLLVNCFVCCLMWLSVGLNLQCWPCESSRFLSLRICQLNVSCESKTKDNVFVNCVVAVQYQVIGDRMWDAFYKANDPTVQMRALVTNVIR